MDDYAGRVLADRYRLPLPPSDEYELTETRAFDTYSGQEVLVRQVPLPEVVEAEVLGEDGLPDGFTARDRGARRPAAARTATRRPSDPAVRRAVEAAQAAARIPDHPRLDQVFDVFAEGGSLWIVSELVSAQPLSALLVEKPLSPYRAAEVASDVLMALRVLHAHGWVHRNITARTVLVCDDGRVMLTGLAVGAAEEALCGYDPVPPQDGDEDGRGQQGQHGGGAAVPASLRAQAGGAVPRAGSTAPRGSVSPSGSTTPPGPRAPGGSTLPAVPGNSRGGGAIGFGGAGGGTATGATAAAVGPGAVDPEAARRAAIEARAAGGLPGVGAESGGASASSAALARREAEVGGDARAARAGAIAAYRAGARAAARVQETQQPALPGARPPAEGERGTAQANGSAQLPYSGGNGVEQHPPGTTPPGQIADPYGVRNTAWHGATPRPGTGGQAPAVQGDRPFPQQEGGGTGALSPGGTGTFPGANTPAPGGTPALTARTLLLTARTPRPLAAPPPSWRGPFCLRRGPLGLRRRSPPLRPGHPGPRRRPSRRGPRRPEPRPLHLRRPDPRHRSPRPALHRRSPPPRPGRTRSSRSGRRPRLRQLPSPSRPLGRAGRRRCARSPGPRHRTGRRARAAGADDGRGAGDRAVGARAGRTGA